jgi:hypothetical protein
MARDRKPASASTTPATYTAWKDAATKDLVERHGLRTNVREKAWRNWFIEGVTSAEAADHTTAAAAQS